MTGHEVWGRAADVVWLPRPGGGLLLLAGDASQPVHVGHPGLAVWECLAQPRRLSELALELDPTSPTDQAAEGLRSVLLALADHRLCEVSREPLDDERHQGE